MNRVAINQDTAEAERAHYVYVQHAKMTSRRGNTVMCEEITDYRFTPAADGTDEQLLKVDGKFLKNHKFINYSKLLPRDEDKPKDAGKDSDKDKSATKEKDKQDKKDKKDKDPAFDPNSDETLDRDLVENMRWNLIHDKSKDSIQPTSSRSRARINSNTRFACRPRANEWTRRLSHRISPKKKDDFGWSGDAFIDTTAYQPVLVTTGMARKIPFAVRTLLGTDVPASALPSPTHRKPTASGSPSRSRRNSRSTYSTSSTARSSSTPRTATSKKTHVTSRIVGEATQVDPPQPKRIWVPARGTADARRPRSQEQGLRLSPLRGCGVS